MPDLPRCELVTQPQSPRHVGHLTGKDIIAQDDNVLILNPVSTGATVLELRLGGC